MITALVTAVSLFGGHIAADAGFLGLFKFLKFVKMARRGAAMRDSLVKKKEQD